MISRHLVFLLLLSWHSGADAFVVSPLTIHENTQRWAKKASNKQPKKKPTTGAGFGAAATTNKKKKSVSSSDDYAIFPALEPQVKETLVTTDQDVAGELPVEIYHRLDQIYGFSQFNHVQQGKVIPAMSFEHMLSGSFEEEEEEASPITQLPPYDKIQVLHVDPLVLSVENFFTPEECDAYIDMPENTKKDEMFKTGSMTVGKDAQAKAQRTSTTWFSHYKNVPALMAKASRLLGLEGIDQWEEPQTVRYRRSEKFTWHLDALGPGELTSSQGGQRIATLLVYHTDLDEGEGGATVFRDLRDQSGERLKVRPKKGSALVFFPSAGGIPNQPLDIRTLHCGEQTKKDKWISQLWLRATPNAYQPTAPVGNSHAAAAEAIGQYCQTAAVTE